MALVELWWSFGGALVEPWSGFTVALTSHCWRFDVAWMSHCPPNPLPITWLWCGFDMALGGFSDQDTFAKVRVLTPPGGPVGGHFHYPPASSKSGMACGHKTSPTPPGRYLLAQSFNPPWSQESGYGSSYRRRRASRNLAEASSRAAKSGRAGATVCEGFSG